MRRYIGEKLKQAMRQANKTPDDISDALNIPLGTLYGYMNDIYAPEIKRGKQIAEYLGCSMDDLYGQNKTKQLRKSR